MYNEKQRDAQPRVGIDTNQTIDHEIREKPTNVNPHERWCSC